MSINNSNQSNDYVVLGNDGLIDISSGTPIAAEGYSDGFGAGGPSNPNGGKKKIVIISAVAAAVVVVLGAAGVLLFQNLNKESEAAKQSEEFMYAENTVVSGVDISNRTVELAKKLLERNEDKFVTPITFDIDVNGKNFQLKEADFTYTYNIDDVLAQIKSDTEKNQLATDENGKTTYTITAAVVDDSITKNVSKLCEENDSEPKNAYVTDFKPYSENRFSFEEAVNGIKVDAKDLSTKIKDGFSKGNSVSKIAAVTETLKADMDAETLESKLVKLSTYETYSTNTENGTSNMKVALSACNGSVIKPGENWSFNSCTGDSNLESNGYKSAHVISEGKIIDGIGGGICQASSTIYNAAVRANLEIEERHNHQWASSYVPTGLDATIDYPNLDLVLSNPTKYQMFLECRVEGSTLYASFWGVKSDKWDDIHTRNEVTDQGSKSYTVRAWRIYLKDGKEVDSEELFKSTYDLDYGVVFIAADNDAKLGGSGSDSNSSGDNDSYYDGGGGGGGGSQSSTPQSSDSDPVVETDPPSSSDASSDTPSQSSQEEPPVVPEEAGGEGE
ncbi:VanW family protein [Ruminococcus difficilis]|uniref:VanW family protein n=1 Tax=Ruminococcus difficilis TaxID=2763069 RepID=A0A934U185_9FIRM|nr:VanW family protein [Ruminococcus difficilis]MBK6088668.1 VanW family protein [Ruminococcus difficilis]